MLAIREEWRKYRSKTHGLRSAYATASRMAGVPLSVVRDRMGHESERTTERHYLGRVAAQTVAGPFAGVPRLASATSPGATVLPFPDYAWSRAAAANDVA